MQNLYTESDHQAVRSQLKRRLLVLLGLSLLFLAVIIWTLILDDHKANRPELYTTLAVLLWGFTAIFFWDLLCKPLHCYARFIDTALHGRCHEVQVEFSRRNEEKSVVDGVTYRDLIFLGEADKHGDRDRMFYWDAELPDPPFAPGDQVTLRYYDRFITGWSRQG